MVSLETLAMAQNPQEAGPAAPPKRHRKFTISYASATKAGIIQPGSSATSNQNHQDNGNTITPETPNTQESDPSSNQQKLVDDNSTNKSNIKSSLSNSLANSKNQPTNKDIDAELQELKGNLERRMEKQENQMSEIIQVIKAMNDDFEQRMIHVVLAALSKEKEMVQEITHGRVFHATEAPLADEEGNLPYGGKVQLGGPLDRLHHVEVTVQQMASALDTILDHIQKDPTAKHLFHNDDSETSTIIKNPPTMRHSNQVDNTDKVTTTDNDVQMTTKEHSGTKRQHSTGSLQKNQHGPDPITNSSPNKSPPSKKRPESYQPSANPDDDIRERGRP
jgi:hypothetical protein